MARGPQAKRIRIVAGGVVDEHGQRWDRIQGETYYLSSDELTIFSGRAARFLTSAGYGSPVVEVDRAGFETALYGGSEHRVTGYRSSQGGAVMLLVDTSDC